MAEYQEIPLLPGEQVIFAADFTPSPLARANKVGLIVTHQRVALIHPQHMFSFFKVGHTVSSSPIAAISQLTVGRLLSQHHVRRAIYAGFFGLFILFYGTSLGGGDFGAMSMLLALCLFGIAAFQAWLARRLGLSIRNFGGGTLSLSVDQAEYQAMLSTASIIQQLMRNTVPGTTLPPPSMNSASQPYQRSPSPTQPPSTYGY
jgi:hypothetical protein